MVQLDHALIHQARRLIDGANIHRGKELIFLYEHAVLLHNEGSSGHIVYQDQFENALREFVQRESSGLNCHSKLKTDRRRHPTAHRMNSLASKGSLKHRQTHSDVSATQGASPHAADGTRDPRPWQKHPAEP
jgi:hypothetical protein